MEKHLVLFMDAIIPAQTEYASEDFSISEKEKTLRFHVNYRKMNSEEPVFVPDTMD